MEIEDNRHASLPSRGVPLKEWMHEREQLSGDLLDAYVYLLSELEQPVCRSLGGPLLVFDAPESWRREGLPAPIVGFSHPLVEFRYHSDSAAQSFRAALAAAPCVFNEINAWMPLDEYSERAFADLAPTFSLGALERLPNRGAAQGQVSYRTGLWLSALLMLLPDLRSNGA